MSDTETPEPEPEATETETKGLVDKAKDAAADIDVHAIVEKAKVVAVDVKDKSVDAASTVKDKSVDAASTVKDKVSGFVGSNEDKFETVIDKAGHFVDDKLTRHKFSDKIDKAQEVAKGAVHKVGATANDSEAASSDADAGDEEE